MTLFAGNCGLYAFRLLVSGKTQRGDNTCFMTSGTHRSPGDYLKGASSQLAAAFPPEREPKRHPVADSFIPVHGQCIVITVYFGVKTLFPSMAATDPGDGKSGFPVGIGRVFQGNEGCAVTRPEELNGNFRNIPFLEDQCFVPLPDDRNLVPGYFLDGPGMSRLCP